MFDRCKCISPVCLRSRYFARFITKNLTEKRWREVFLLVAGLLQNTDEMLEQMELAAQQLINIPKLKALLKWAEYVTTGSEGDYTPTSKRAVAIYFARSLDLDRALDLAHTLDLARALDLDYATE